MNVGSQSVIRWTLTTIVGSCMLQACAGMRPGYETPTVTVNSFKAIPSEGTFPNFEIGLHVINPNSEPLKLEGVSYTVSLEGHDVMKGVGNNLPVIEGYGEGQFTVTASANLIAGIRLFKDLLNKQNDTLSYEFVAKLDPGTFHPSIRVKDAGEISLADIGKVQ